MARTTRRAAASARGLNVTEVEQSLGALLRAPYQHLVEGVYGELAASGFDDVRPAHGAVLRHISPGGSWTVELAEKAQMTKQSMGYLVDYLRERGYVELRPDPDDRRAKCVHLTERGRELQRAALETSRRLERDVASRLGEDDLARLRELLARLASQLKETKRPDNEAERSSVG